MNIMNMILEKNQYLLQYVTIQTQIIKFPVLSGYILFLGVAYLQLAKPHVWLQMSNSIVLLT
jgi:hypothetical protein